MKHDVIIIGAGAAGLFCAIEAGKRGRSVLLLDKSKKPAEKIRISGGGRCNFTNIHTTASNYLSQNTHFCKSALGRYQPSDFIELVEKYDIAYHEKTLGQLFCDGSSKQIIQMLLDECKAAKVTLELESHVKKVAKLTEHFCVTMGNDEELICDSLVIATGGPSIPKMGATGWGYEVARQFKLKMVTPYPALVPFTFNEERLTKLKPLAGISLESIAKCNGTSFREGMLFTHRGLSGPAILQISSYWHEGDEVELNLLPDIELLPQLKAARDEKPKQSIHTVLAQWLPKKLAQYLEDEHQAHGYMAELGNKKLQAVADAVNRWRFVPNGTEGYRTAEVTAGGVDTSELSSKSLEAKNVNGLYFIGEVVDVTGHLGGYNFQWAWASGFAAGQHV